MKRYKVPCIAFINKCDRSGADPSRVTAQLRSKLGHNAVAMQIPIGLEMDFQGVVDLVAMKALYFDGENGETVRVEEIPAEYRDEAAAKRLELIESASMFSDELMEAALEEREIPQELLISALRAGTIRRELTPVFIGSAYKNKGVQKLLDAVVRYLPIHIDEVRSHHDPIDMVRQRMLEKKLATEAALKKIDGEAPTGAPSTRQSRRTRTSGGGSGRAPWPRSCSGWASRPASSASTTTCQMPPSSASWPAQSRSSAPAAAPCSLRPSSSGRCWSPCATSPSPTSTICLVWMRAERKEKSSGPVTRLARSSMAPGRGFEPRLADPESAVLPLNEGAASRLANFDFRWCSGAGQISRFQGFMFQSFKVARFKG